MLSLFDELRLLVSALEAQDVEYALAGALALAMHGAPRATTDIDVLIRPEDVGRVVEQAKAQGFRFEALPIRFSDGMEVRRVTKIEAEDPYETLTIDLLLVNENLETVWDSRRRLEADFGAMWVISRDSLIRMKTWAGRDRDMADVRRLEELDR
ncbi:MAG TPA: DUF6036 family nucleotidyltransferase [Thermoanaerobaculia bacterium]|jgi:hypothetical protein